ncbi:MAG: 6-bladed beta-propeller [Pseudomonadota bacterium]
MYRSTSTRATQLLYLILAGVLLSGCAETKHIFRYVESDQQKVWPLPPEPPRYQYVGLLTGEPNFVADSTAGFRQSLTKAFLWVAGVFGREERPLTLQRPQTGVVDAAGRILVTDVSRQAVYVFDTARGKFEVWEDAGTNTRFVAPIGIAIAADGSVLVADAELGSVVRLDKSGKPLGRLGGGVLKRPSGLAYDPAKGWIYVADTHEHNLKVFDIEGRFIKLIGKRGEEPGTFNGPTHLAFVNNRLYVTDALNARIQIFDNNGEFQTTFGRRGVYLGDMPHPKGVTSDAGGRIYVVESYYDHLLIYDEQGRFLLPIGGAGQAIGEFNLPSGAWTDDRGLIYVSDMFNQRIVILKYLDDQAPAAASK